MSFMKELKKRGFFPVLAAGRKNSSMAKAETSLKKISLLVAEKLRREQQCSIQETVSYVVEKTEYVKSDITLKRRVYDVLNVLAAAGIINKTQNFVNWIGIVQVPNSQILFQEKTHDTETVKRRINAKLETLKYKVNILKQYNAICTRNRLLPRPTKSIGLTCFVIDANGATTEKTANNLNVTFDSKPTLYTPLEILQNIDFQFDMDQQLISKYPKIKEALDLIDEMEAMDST